MDQVRQVSCSRGCFWSCVHEWCQCPSYSSWPRVENVNVPRLLVAGSYLQRGRDIAGSCVLKMPPLNPDKPIPTVTVSPAYRPIINHHQRLAVSLDPPGSCRSRRRPSASSSLPHHPPLSVVVLSPHSRHSSHRLLCLSVVCELS